MPKCANKQGYTIVETMIFLAISGLMFVIAASFINGKQAKAEFQQGLNNINSQIQQAINDVGNGYYISGENVKCSIDIITNKPKIEAATTERGTNQDCTFIGKILEFKANGDDQLYKLSMVAGRKTPGLAGGVATDVPTDFEQAKPTISGSELVNETKKLQWGLTVHKMSSTGGVVKGNVGAIAIMHGFAKGTDGTGAQSTLTIPIGTGLGNSMATTGIDEVQLKIDAAAKTSITTICFKGGNGQYGAITVGGKGQRTATAVIIGNNDENSIPGGVCVI